MKLKLPEVPDDRPTIFPERKRQSKFLMPVFREELGRIRQALTGE
jgi:hypothetical protein